MPRRSNASDIDARLSKLPRLPVEQVAAKIIEDCDGDPRAAVAELIAIVRAVLEENKTLAEAISAGYARHDPLQHLILKLP